MPPVSKDLLLGPSLKVPPVPGSKPLKDLHHLNYSKHTHLLGGLEGHLCTADQSGFHSLEAFTAPQSQQPCKDTVVGGLHSLKPPSSESGLVLLGVK